MKLRFKWFFLLWFDKILIFFERKVWGRRSSHCISNILLTTIFIFIVIFKIRMYIELMTMNHSEACCLIIKRYGFRLFRMYIKVYRHVISRVYRWDKYEYIWICNYGESSLTHTLYKTVGHFQSQHDTPYYNKLIVAQS